MLVAEVARCKKSFVSRCKIHSFLLQKLLVAKNHSLLVAKFARYSLQKLLVAKNHSLLVAKFARYSLQNWFVTHCRTCSLQKLTCYSLQNSLVARCWGGVTFCNFMIKKLHHRCFPVNFCETLRKPILWKIKERLLVKIKSKYQQTFYLIELLLNCLIKLNQINTETSARRCSWEQLLWRILKCFRKAPVAEVGKFSEGFV